MKAYWFEVFECFRKFSLVGVPVFFDPGSSLQLVYGLLICFINFGFYMAFSPYHDIGEDRLAELCQVQHANSA
jgi:hypothetical protein